MNNNQETKCNPLQEVKSNLCKILKSYINQGDLDKYNMGIYIFGTGQGGQAALEYLKLTEWHYKYNIRGFFDNNIAQQGEEIAGLPIYVPNKELITDNDVIIIASFTHYEEMELQLLEMGVAKENIILPGNWLKTLLPENNFNSTLQYRYVENEPQKNKFYIEYVRNIFSNAISKSSEFVEYDNNLNISLTEQDVKLIAFYLPQFHSIPENDLWWGKGFTEWTNVTKAVPQYMGHYQPQLPIDLGFYDLRNIEVMKRQIELARKYGIFGFCFYHYWFAGKRLLEMPVNKLLNHLELDIPFCLCWANENWNRRWDAKENELLIAQNHSPEDDVAFIEDISRHFSDTRYIRIQGKPLLIIYRPLLFPDITATVERWRTYCIRAGIGDLFIIGVKNYGFNNPRKYGLDAAVEFPPHDFCRHNISNDILLMNPQFKGLIYDYQKDIDKRLEIIKRRMLVEKNQNDDITFRTVMPGWDNTARRPNNSLIYHGSSPEKYQKWLENIILLSKSQASIDTQMVFINAWNEWAEGAHLEPDRKYGYAYLQATANALIRTREEKFLSL
ncbi:glycoside hydrolase family 99-like domain-containing protein|uniref:Glycosyltransferase WbsX n=1 Tax=Dendrosporobacter quercicolus TaxID=146817 RepID=A0A1G9WVW0_9FIRM|nr:glycoside hydrolase family 99-like domain-containing protein [Dendrosporobacter quercicolus]NSL49228.1 glycoside hydrolase family 99-like domain-containing protein [Dendrosporobacter quercicolus DSM 1736]SDM88569.1 Glycosyltransferase WbsX [Dendrosporobacter quercicolus]